MKQIVTDEWTGIKERFQGRQQKKNYARLVATSNKNTFMPSSIESVRWALFTVSDRYQLNRPHFDKVEEWLLGNGRNVCMYELNRVKHKNADFQHPPDTGERLAQQMSSMSSIQAFWYDILRDEDFNTQIATFNKHLDWNEDEPFVPIKMLMFRYRDWCWARGLHRRKQASLQDFRNEIAPLIGMSQMAVQVGSWGKKDLKDEALVRGQCGYMKCHHYDNVRCYLQVY